MADEKVTSSIGTDESFGISMGDQPEVERDEGAATEADLEDISMGAEEGGQEEGSKSDDGAEGGSDEDDNKDEDTGEDLGEFDPENAEAWDARYKTEDGKLNKDALSNEFWKNQKAGNEGLNEGTYQYLDSLGIDRETAKQVEAALVTQADAEVNKAKKTDDKIFDIAGGPGRGR